MQFNSIEASPFDPATAYLAGTMYKFDDYHPYLFKTTDFGKSWQSIDTGIPDGAFTRVVREDPNKRNLLYAGTETGIYVSFNGGAHWQSLQLNLPVTPIAALAIQKREHELVAATHGRAFWVLDDTDILAQLSDGLSAEDMHLFQPKHTYRIAGAGRSRVASSAGANPASGAVVYYWLKDKPQGELNLEFLDASGKLIRKVSSKTPEHKRDTQAADAEEDEDEAPRRCAGSAVA